MRTTATQEEERKKKNEEYMKKASPFHKLLVVQITAVSREVAEEEKAEQEAVILDQFACVRTVFCRPMATAKAAIEQSPRASNRTWKCRRVENLSTLGVVANSEDESQKENGYKKKRRVSTGVASWPP